MSKIGGTPDNRNAPPALPVPPEMSPRAAPITPFTPSRADRPGSLVQQVPTSQPLGSDCWNEIRQSMSYGLQMVAEAERSESLQKELELVQKYNQRLLQAPRPARPAPAPPRPPVL
jgi:hypothetical protein